MPVQNAEIAAMFDQAAELLEIGGENQFRVRAYRRAARVIEGLPKAAGSLLKSGSDLSELPGIGKDLAGKIADIVKTGHFDLLDTLKRKLPGEIGDMAALPGLGPKRVKLLYDKLKVRTLDDLREAIKTGRLRELRGFGPVIEKKLLGALEKPQPEKRFKLAVAEAEAEALVGFLRGSGRVVVAGSYRRRRDTVGDLDVLVTAKDGAAVGDRLVKYENVAEVARPWADAHHRDAAFRLAGRCARGAGGKLWRGAAVFHRFESPQHRAARARQPARLEAERIRPVLRQTADRRRHGGGSLREARARLHRAGIARGPRRDRSLPWRASCPDS